MKLKCQNKKCENEGDYKGKAKFYATCPNCMYKVNIAKAKIEEVVKNERRNNETEICKLA